MTETRPFREVRARYDATSITVYQAYSPEIAEPATAAGRFVPPFSTGRMTWIKPSFLWMMYRCGWATKPGQERVLAVRVSRDGFEEALRHASLSHYEPRQHASEKAWRDQLAASPVRIQWDPERTPDGSPLPWRSLQVGLGPAVVPHYVDDWTLGIDDITGQLDALRHDPAALQRLLDEERPYPLPDDVAERIGATR